MDLRHGWRQRQRDQHHGRRRSQWWHHHHQRYYRHRLYLSDIYQSRRIGLQRIRQLSTKDGRCDRHRGRQRHECRQDRCDYQRFEYWFYNRALCIESRSALYGANHLGAVVRRLCCGEGRHHAGYLPGVLGDRRQCRSWWVY